MGSVGESHAPERRRASPERGEVDMREMRSLPSFTHGEAGALRAGSRDNSRN